jgi:hypothetical protein
MSRIILTKEQANAYSPAELVEICDPQGRVIASIPPKLTPDEWEQIQKSRAYTGPGISSDQIHQMLEALEQAWEKEGPFDKARALEIAQQFRETRGS